MPSALGSAALPFRWKLWGCGGPRWILCDYIKMAGSELLIYDGLRFSLYWTLTMYILPSGCDVFAFC